MIITIIKWKYNKNNIEKKTQKKMIITIIKWN